MRAIALTRLAANDHFRNSDFAGTRIIGMTEEELERLVNEAYERCGGVLIPGYADFCKHLFVPNPTATKSGIAAVTPENAHLLRSGYEVRYEGELPVLTRWFEGVEAERAEWLDIILYSREQLVEEDKDKPLDQQDVPDAKWGIVAINGELQPAESPLNPITMMRNALGKEQGGSGTPLNPVAYAQSVEFWSNHATVR